LTAESRIDRHQQDHIHIGQDLVEHMQWCGRIEGHTGLDTHLSDLLNGAMQMWAGLGMHGNVAGSRPCEFGDVLLGLVYHQVHVQWQLSGLANGPHYERPNGDVGTKCPSMTSQWIASAPPASAAATCSPNRQSRRIGWKQLS